MQASASWEGGGCRPGGHRGLSFPQAPSEAEPAADLIDMGPDPVATGNLSSQLAGMSEYCRGLREGTSWCLVVPGLPSHQHQNRVPPNQVPSQLLLQGWHLGQHPGAAPGVPQALGPCMSETPLLCECPSALMPQGLSHLGVFGE